MSDVRKPAPDLEFEPAPCPKCGAVDELDAETKCRPTQDQTGEWSCCSEFRESDGLSVQPTAASIAALDAHYGELLDQMEDAKP